MAGEPAYVLDGLAVPAVLEELHVLLERVAHEHPDVLPGDLMLFETAVVEIAGNVVEHGRPPGQVPYTFSLTVLPDRLEGVLHEHGGVHVPPSDHAMPDAMAEDGRGLALAHLALDTLDYDHAEGVNTWRMTRRRRAAGDDV